MNDIEYSGVWWLPSNPQDTVAGTLTFSNEEGLELTLIGALGDATPFNSSTDHHELILGISGDGKLITLNGCSVTSLKIGMPGFARQSYRCHRCYVGFHVSEPNELQFSRFDIRYSHLPDWVRVSGFTIRPNLEQHKLDVFYTLPNELEGETSRGKVSLTFTLNTSGDAIEEMSLRQSVSLEVKADKKYPVHELISQFIRPLQNLLSLATTKPNTILELNVYSKEVSFEKSNGEVVETPIKVFFQQRYFEPRQGKLLIPDYMLFTLHDIEGDFPSIIERWFQVSADLDSVCDLYFGIQYTPSMYSENRFLNIAQAVESYHRRRMKNNVLPKAEHKALKEAILSQVDAEHREWLKGQLAYSNEPRLEQRIRELTENVYEAVAPLISNKEEFAKKVKDTRNFLTHYDKRLEDKAAKGSELFWLTRKLSYLLQSCFLMELGLPLEKCAQLLRRNQAFIFAMGQAN